MSGCFSLFFLSLFFWWIDKRYYLSAVNVFVIFLCFYSIFVTNVMHACCLFFLNISYECAIHMYICMYVCLVCKLVLVVLYKLLSYFTYSLLYSFECVYIFFFLFLSFRFSLLPLQFFCLTFYKNVHILFFFLIVHNLRSKKS